jgi:hypothetical protein
MDVQRTQNGEDKTVRLHVSPLKQQNGFRLKLVVFYTKIVERV